MNKILNMVSVLFCVFILGVMFGYWWCTYHKSIGIMPVITIEEEIGDGIILVTEQRLDRKRHGDMHR